MPSLVPWLVALPGGGYRWEHNPKVWKGYRGRQVPARGVGACRSQRAATKYPTRQAALDVSATIPGSRVVPYENRW